VTGGSREIAMTFDLVCQIPGDALLGQIASYFHRPADLGAVTIRRDAGESWQLTIAPPVDLLPDPASAVDPVDARMAQTLQASQGHLEMASRSTISLHGSSELLRCTGEYLQERQMD
jgi:hypothetical protein